MKILYVTTISNTVNGFLIPHIKMLIKNGHQVDVAFNIQKEVDSEILRLGCRVHNIKFKRTPLDRENFIAYKEINKVVIEGGYDLIHTHTPIASFLTRLACRNLPNVKILYTAHGFHFYKNAPFKNWLFYFPMEKLVSRYTDGIITINTEDNQLAKKYKLSKGNTVYYTNGVGIDLEKFRVINNIEKNNLRKKFGYNNKDFILFYAAELNYNKHQDLLINTIKLLKEKIPNLKLLFAGNGPLYNKYKRQVKIMGLEKNIEFLGFRKDVPDLLKISDIALSSSRREGLPVNVMEAMASGLPLVVTNCRGNRDLVIDGVNGYVVENNVGKFSEAIQMLYDSPDIREKFGSTGIELIKKYSLKHVIKELDAIYTFYTK